MKQSIKVNLNQIEKNLDNLKNSNAVLDYLDNYYVMDAGGNTKILIIDLVFGNDYNCYSVSGDCSCLYENHSSKLTFSDEDNCINYLDNEIKQINDDTLEIILNLVDDKTGCDYEKEMYEYCANLIAQYYVKYYL